MQVNRTRCFSFIVGPALLAVTLGTGAHAQATNTSPLRGITTLKVIVSLGHDAPASNITEDRVRTIGELKLRLAGLRVLSADEAGAERVVPPYLWISVDAFLRPEFALTIYHVRVSLRQGVISPINGAMVAAVLWEQAALYSVGSSQMPDAATKDLEQILDSFVNSFLAANPRR